MPLLLRLLTIPTGLLALIGWILTAIIGGITWVLLKSLTTFPYFTLAAQLIIIYILVIKGVL